MCDSGELLGRPWLACFPDYANQERWSSLKKQIEEFVESTPPANRKWKLRVVCFGDDVQAADREAQNALSQAETPSKDDAQTWEWIFLSSSPDELRSLRSALFGATSQGNPTGDSAPADPALALVDPQGDVRAVYSAAPQLDAASLRQDLTRTFDEAVFEIHNLLSPDWLAKRQAEQEAARHATTVDSDFRFVDRRRESGIGFRHFAVDDTGRRLVAAHYDHGNGMAVADVDGDGRLDVYFVSQVGPNGLWRNLGDGKFADITESAGVGVRDRIKVSASFADVDNDGDPDLYVTAVRANNILFRNDGQGRFTDVSAESGVDYSGHSSSAVWFDYDRDGLLDLLLVNVGVYTTDDRVTLVHDRFSINDDHEYQYYRSNNDAFAAHLKPERAERSRLFRNRGAMKFADMTMETGLVDESWSGDAAILDANHDGWPDVYLINMQGHDQYYENDGGKKFIKRSRELFPYTPWGSMGISVFDHDNDGLQDIFITDMHTDMAKEPLTTEEKRKLPSNALAPEMLNTDGKHVLGNALFHQTAPGKFEEVSDALNVETYWPWGSSIGDFNADSFDDIFVTAGMNYSFRYAINSLLLNNAGHGFVDAEFLTGIEPRRGGITATPWFELDGEGRDRTHKLVKRRQLAGADVSRLVVWSSLASRSSAVFDLDDDGDLDIVTNEFHSPPQVLINDLAQRRDNLRFLKIRLRGSASNRDGLGATVQVRSGGQTLTKVHDGKSGYLSQSSIPLYFGLAAADSVEQIDVAWPSGAKQTIMGPVAIDRLLEITEPPPSK